PENELLPLFVLENTHRNSKNPKHRESDERNQLSGEVRDLELLPCQSHEGADRIAETHRKKSQENRHGRSVVHFVSVRVATGEAAVSALTRAPAPATPASSPYRARTIGIRPAEGFARARRHRRRTASKRSRHIPHTPQRR